MYFFAFPSNMMLPQVLSLVVLTVIPRAVSNPGSKGFLQAGDLLLEHADPFLLSFLHHLSDKDNLADLEANIRRQRQIRFKNSYQELPAGLKNPLRDDDSEKNLANLSYFVQVDVIDAPASTALTTLPKGAKTYFPPQVSQPGVSFVEDTIYQKKPNQAFKNGKRQQSQDDVTSTFQSITQEKDSLTSLQDASNNFKTNLSPKLKDQNLISNSDLYDINSTVSTNSPLTSSAADSIDLSPTSPQLQNNSSDSLFSTVHNSLPSEKQNVTHSSYLSYTPFQSQLTKSLSAKALPKSIVSTPSKSSTSSPVSSSPTIQTLPPLQFNPGSSFSSPSPPSASPFFVFTTSSPPNIPPVVKQSTSRAPSTFNFPKKVSGSATSPLPYFVRVSSSQRQPFFNQQQSNSFSTSFSEISLGLQQNSQNAPSLSRALSKSQTFQSRPLPKPQTFQFIPSSKSQTSQFRPLPKSQTFQSRPLSKSQTFQSRPLTKSQISQSRPLPKSQTFQSGPLPKSQTSQSRLLLKSQTSQSRPLSKSQTSQSKPLPKSRTPFHSPIGNNPTAVQLLVPPTRPHSPIPKSSTKPFSSGSSKVFQVNKGSRRSDSGIGKATSVLQSPSKDGKTRTLDNSDSFYTGSIPGRSGSDYPTLQTIPQTGFDCASKTFGGYFADPETNCQVFHACWGRRSASFICPVGTIFSQRLLVCDWWYNVDCSSTNAFIESTQEHLKGFSWGRNQI